jgi:hypothetical protein
MEMVNAMDPSGFCPRTEVRGRSKMMDSNTSL